MKKIIFSFFVIFCLQTNLVLSQYKTTDCPVIPTPASYVASSETFDISDKTLQINRTNLPKEIEKYLVKNLKDAFSIQTIISDNSGEVIFKPQKNVPENSYSIDIRESVITISYSNEASCFYAINSFLQLIQKNDVGYYINLGFLMDYPKFEWRGLHLDVSRHFYSVDEVKHFIDLMALYKFNTFHWHLTDDQGWRIEIKQFPKLTEIGAWRDSTLIGHYNEEPRKYEHKRVGGFYTQEQIKDVVAYAQKRFISVIPEIEMPGHSRAALAAYPEYSCTGIKQGVPGIWGIFDDIYCSKPETISFLQKILDEVIPLFPSPYVHIGGDEAPKTRWHTCPRCQKVIKENGLKDEHELQSYFIRQMDVYLTAKGKKLIGWDEILEGGLSPNATVMSWRGSDGGIEAAKQNHDVVMSPNGYCYFDHYQSGNTGEPLAIGGFLPLEKVYQFNPVPEQLSADQRRHILGGQANLWTEYISTMEKLEYMTYPRALALSQSLWCDNTKKPDYETFKKIFIKYQMPFLDRYKVNYSKAIFYAKMEITPNKQGLALRFKGAEPTDSFYVTSFNTDLQKNIDSVVMKSNDSLVLTRENDFPMTIEYTVTPYNNVSGINHFSIEQSHSIGFPIEFKTPFNPKFSNRGNLALVDGVKGKRPWKGDEWLGFTKDTIEFTVDLIKTRQLQNVNLGFLSANGSWIYLPETVQLFVSTDKTSWSELKKQAVTEETFFQEVNKKARYLKVVVISKDKIPVGSDGEGNKPWTFMDEIEIEYE